MILGLGRADVVVQCEEQILNCNMPNIMDGVTYENQDEETVEMIEKSPSEVGLNFNQIGRRKIMDFVIHESEFVIFHKS